MISNNGIVYIWEIDGEDIIKPGHIKTVNLKSLKRRKTELESALNQTNSGKKRTLNLLAAVVSSNPAVQDKDLNNQFFVDEILNGNKTNRRPYFTKGEVASEYKSKSIKAVKYINYLRKQKFIATSLDDVERILKMPIPDYDDWGFEKFLIPDSSGTLEEFLGNNKIKEIEPDTDGDYYTPSYVIDLAKKVMGDIDLDPASSKRAQSGDDQQQKGVGAKKFFDYYDNGLNKEWEGRIFLNPPFGQWPQWCSKVIAEIDSKRVKELFMIVPDWAISNQTFFDTDFLYRMYFCLLRSRVQYWGKKNFTDAAAWKTIFFYYVPNGDKFKQEMADFGVVYDPPTKIKTASKSIKTYSSLDLVKLEEFL